MLLNNPLLSQQLIMSAIKYVGRNLWRFKISYKLYDSRGAAYFWVTTPGNQSHPSHAIRDFQRYMLNVDGYEDYKIESIKRKGVLHV